MVIVMLATNGKLKFVYNVQTFSISAGIDSFITFLLFPCSLYIFFDP